MNRLTSIAPAATVPSVSWLGTDYSIPLASAASGGLIGAFTSLVPPLSGPPLHVHHGEDEVIHVIEGVADFWLDGQITRLVAGQAAFLPRDVPHTFRVVGDRPGRFLGVVTPGGFEGFFAAAAAADVGPHDPAALAAFGDLWKLRFLGPSPLAD